MADTMIVASECVREEPSGVGWRWKCGRCGLSSLDGRSVLHPSAGLAETSWQMNRPGSQRGS